MSNDTQFVDGLRVYAPREGAPDFVICNLVVNADELRTWLSTRSGEVRIDIKRSRNERLYASVNDFRPQGSRDAQSTQRQTNRQPAPSSDFEDDDLPPF